MLEHELDLEMAEVLPDRETLGTFTLNINVVPQLNVAVNTAVLSPGAALTIAQSNGAIVPGL